MGNKLKVVMGIILAVLEIPAITIFITMFVRAAREVKKRDAEGEDDG